VGAPERCALPDGVEWARDGKIPVPVVRTPLGRWLVTVPERGGGRVVAYCRVSPADQRDDLEWQAGRVAAGAAGCGLAVSQVVTEVGSGMIGHRRKLTRLLSDLSVTVISLSTGTVLPGSGSGIWPRRWPPQAAASWCWMRWRPPMTWYAM
jgi:Resolvase, N terminal domain